jgi:hypothetical protein
MKQKLIAYWNSLPPWAKGAILIGGAAASGAVKKYYDAPNPCWSLHCIGLLALAALHVGGVAAGAWLIKSPIGQKLLAELPAQNPPALKILLLVAFLAFAATHSTAQLPNPKLTPGAVRTTNTKQVCSTTTKQFRNTTEAMKKQACAEYKIAACPKAKVMEIDHLISLELGGADEVANLWPQLATYPDGSPGFHVKDKLENDLHRLVCTGRMKLTDAQECIRTDWIACAKKVAAQK